MYHVLNLDKIKGRFSLPTYPLSPFDAGIPLIESSDSTLDEIYYFRWHTFCRHIEKIPGGYVVTEFTPKVPWAGKYNTISCPAGHHFYEGRWLHDPKYMEACARFWMSKDADPRRYSFWAADSFWAFSQITGNFALCESLYEALKENFFAWEKEKGMENGLYYQIDDRDGMEYSIGGSGCRPTINSYMYGDAMALSKIAKRIGKDNEANAFQEKAESIRNRMDELLWDEDAAFYKTLAEKWNDQKAPVRELIGYVPWYFHIPGREKAKAWRFLKDEKYFSAPYGPTTAERNHPDFMKAFDHECLWNGPSWPFATSQTLTALGNLLTDQEQEEMQLEDYYQLLHQYAACHYLSENGKTIPFIDENLDPFTGEWLARKILRSDPNGKWHERGVDYNHSSFCDLVLTGLAGIRPGKENEMIVHPLFTPENLRFFCADGILYHGHAITVLWDQTGEKYRAGKGFHVYADGKEIFHAAQMQKCVLKF